MALVAAHNVNIIHDGATSADSDLGPTTTNTLRVTTATDATIGLDVTKGAGVVDADTIRIAVADDTLTRGAGVVTANTARVAIATDSLTRAAGVVDANTIRVAVADDTLTRGAGVVTASTARVAIATDSLTRGAGIVDAFTTRVAIATDTLTRGAGIVDASTVRVAIADDTTVGLEVALGAGVVTANTVRIAVADDTLTRGAGVVDASTARVAIADDTLTRGAGVVTASTARVAIATDSLTRAAGVVDAFTARVAIADDTLTRGAGVVTASTARVAIATDSLTRAAGVVDAFTARVAIADDTLTRGAGAVTASTARVAIATDSLTRAAGVVDAFTARVAIATDTLTRGAGIVDASTTRVAIATDTLTRAAGNVDASTARVAVATDSLTRNAGNVDAFTTRVALANNTYANLPRTYLDAYGRLRTSDIETIFDSKQIFDVDPVSWNTATVGTGSITYSNAEARSRLAVAAASDTATRQTYRRFNYQPGKSQLIYMSAVIRVAGVFSSNVTSRIGLFSTTNGVFFSYTAGTLNINIRKASADTTVAQASWNMDKFDGTGASGITIDPTLVQTFVINFEWYGVGSVWFGFMIGGTLYWCHRVDNANVATSVYMATPNLPLCYQIVCSAAAGSGSMDAICSSINVEGSQSVNSKTCSFARSDFLNADTVGTEYVAIMFRYKSESAAQISITDVTISVLATTTDPFLVIVRLVRDTTKIVGFGAQVWTSIVNSPLEGSRPTGAPGSATVTADSLDGTSGRILRTAYIPDTASAGTFPARLNSISMGYSIAGVTDVLVISVIPLGANADIYASLTWTE